MLWKRKPRVCVTGGLLVTAVTALLWFWGPEAPLPEVHAIPAVASAPVQLPFYFEANRGQADERVKFLARGPGRTVYLTEGEAVLRVSGNQADSVVRVRFMGANPDPEMEGLEEQPGKANYLVGADPQRWHTRVPTYGKVAYRDLYPGVDLVYHGSDRQLEYDFILAPAADPDIIALTFEGADDLAIDEQGDLVLHTAGGDIRQPRPVVYQEADGSRQTIDGGFVRLSEDRIGFEIGDYDTTRPLVIDPRLVYSTYLGGSDTDFGLSLCVDAAGSAYVAGYTRSTDFPITAEALQTDHGGDWDIYVAKLNASGTGLVYSTYLGGGGADIGLGVAVDGAGCVYLTGMTRSPDFPVTAGAFQTVHGGGWGDAFLAKLNATGTALTFSTYLGGSGSDYAQGGVAVDAAGNAYVSGWTGSSDFPVTPAAFQTSFGGGGRDGFVTKVNASGTGLVYSTYLGGSGFDQVLGSALDDEGNVHATGNVGSIDFPVTEGAFQTIHGGGWWDAYVAKLNADGSALVYASYLGGTDEEFGSGVAVDDAGHAYVAGTTFSTDFPVTAESFQTACGGDRDVFVVKLDPAGSGLAYSTYLGGSAREGLGSVAVGSGGKACVGGYTFSSDFPITGSAMQTTLAGTADAFVAKLDSAGTALDYSTYFGGGGVDYCWRLILDVAGSTYWTGYMNSSDFPITEGAAQTAPAGGYDVVVVKMAWNAPPVCNPSGAGVYECAVQDVVLGGSVADPDGDELSYEWRLGPTVLFAGTIDAPAAGEPIDLPEHTKASAELGLGLHTLVLAVDDGIHDEVTAEIEVEVVDTTAPTLAPVSSHSILWPPNHEMVEVTIHANASDASDGSPALAIEVTSNEPINGPGDGNTEPDYEILSIDQVTGEIRLNLRAERSGGGDGRIYTVTITATDASGNSSVADVTVLVPHDRGKGKKK